MPDLILQTLGTFMSPKRPFEVNRIIWKLVKVEHDVLQQQCPLGAVDLLTKEKRSEGKESATLLPEKLHSDSGTLKTMHTLFTNKNPLLVLSDKTELVKIVVL